jgi:hypothetical protein
VRGGLVAEPDDAQVTSGAGALQQMTGRTGGTGLAVAAVGAAARPAGPAGAWAVAGVGLCVVLLGSAAVIVWRQRRSLVRP